MLDLQCLPLHQVHESTKDSLKVKTASEEALTRAVSQVGRPAGLPRPLTPPLLVVCPAHMYVYMYV
jgi:hypothetical protein